MWTAVLGILNGALAVFDKLLTSWMISREREAGRQEAELERADQALKDLEKAREIEARPQSLDPPDILRRL
jgi:hypothetical protein